MTSVRNAHRRVSETGCILADIINAGQEQSIHRVRVGFLLESPAPSWALISARRLSDELGEPVPVIVLNASPPTGLARGLGHRVLEAVDRSLVGRGRTAWDPVALDNIPDGLDLHQSDDLEHTIKSLQLDFVVVFDRLRLPPNAISAARLGAWRLLLGSGTPPGYGEVARGDPVTRVELVWDRLDGSTLVVAEATNRTYAYSPRVNAEFLATSATSFVAREVRRLHNLGPDRYVAAAEARFGRSTLDDFSKRAPGPLATLLRVGSRVAGRALSDLLYRDQWALLIVNETDPSRLAMATRSGRLIEPPRDRFWADPHLIEHEGRAYLFMEEYVYAEGKGTIAAVELGPDGPVGEVRRVLSEDHHLSYPFVFEHSGTMYMLPEAEESKKVVLYEASQFPWAWRRSATLLDGIRASDATLYRHDGQWWLFAGVAEERGASKDAELHLYFATELQGPWKPHPLNPVVSNVGSARPAGAMFEWDGLIYRPSQDCATRYGYALNLFVVERLTCNEYRERLVHKVLPDENRGWIGLHSISRGRGVAVMDVLRRRLRRP